MAPGKTPWYLLCCVVLLLLVVEGRCDDHWQERVATKRIVWKVVGVIAFVILLAFCKCLTRACRIDDTASIGSGGEVRDAPYAPDYLVTEAGLQNVASKASARLIEASNQSPPAEIPPSGKYIGTVKEGERTKTNIWFLKFYGDGKMTGGTSNAGGVARVNGHMHGVRCFWGETSAVGRFDIASAEAFALMLLNRKPYHMEVDLKILDMHDGKLEGTYIDSRERTGELVLRCVEKEVPSMKMPNLPAQDTVITVYGGNAGNKAQNAPGVSASRTTSEKLVYKEDLGTV